MHPELELLELAHRLLYRPADWRELRERAPGDPADWLAQLRRRGAPPPDLPPAAALRAQARWAGARGVRAACFGAPGYPPALSALALPPPVLFMLGDTPGGDADAVALVGSRRCSAQGREFARRLGAGAAAAGIAVISGMARGIDQASQAGCLAQPGGRTWAVLGSGLDRLYPPEAGRLAAAIEERGGLLSEFPPAVPPLPFHFPRRNRLIACLARALVVVEAGAASGALSTAREAMALGREIGVAPGSPLNPAAAGSNRLLAEGAAPVLCPEDMLALLGRAPAREARAETEWSAQRCLDEGIADLEALAARAGWLLTDAIERLADWERRGEIERLPGGRFRAAGVAPYGGGD